MLFDANLGLHQNKEGRLFSRGKMSWFGGPHDSGVGVDEGLALYTFGEAMLDDFGKLFLPRLDSSMGIARQLNPMSRYCAMRWCYHETPRSVIRRCVVRVESVAGVVVWCRPCDWGPNVKTDRIIDVSDGVMVELRVKTDAFVTATVYSEADARLLGFSG